MIDFGANDYEIDWENYDEQNLDSNYEETEKQSYYNDYNKFLYEFYND